MDMSYEDYMDEKAMLRHEFSLCEACDGEDYCFHGCPTNIPEDSGCSVCTDSAEKMMYLDDDGIRILCDNEECAIAAIEDGKGLYLLAELLD